jgi:hypothetical protein
MEQHIIRMEQTNTSLAWNKQTHHSHGTNKHITRMEQHIIRMEQTNTSLAWNKQTHHSHGTNKHIIRMEQHIIRMEQTNTSLAWNKHITRMEQTHDSHGTNITPVKQTRDQRETSVCHSHAFKEHANRMVIFGSYRLSSTW